MGADVKSELGIDGTAENAFLTEATVAASRVARRLGIRRVARALAAVVPPAVLALVPLTVAGLLWPVSRGGFVAVGVFGVVVAFVTIRAFRTREDLVAAGNALDHAGDGADRVQFALECRARLARGETLDPYFSLELARLGREPRIFAVERAAPLAPTPEVLRAGGLALCLVLLAFLRFPEPEDPVRAPRRVAPREAGALLGGSELELANAGAAELGTRMRSEAGRELAADFGALARDLGQPGLDAAEAFRRIAELEAELEARSLEGAILEAGWAARGADFEKARALRDAGRHLSGHRPEDAAGALDRLAERLESGAPELTKAELDELREELARERGPIPLQTEAERAAASARSRAERERSRLLQKKQEEGALGAEDAADLARAERELERLDRRTRKSASAALSEIDRRLLEAARELREEQKKAAGDSIEEAAREFRESAERVLSDREKEEMIERLRQMKELLRRQRESGATEAERAFEKRARGLSPEAGEGAGEAGEGEPGDEGGEGEEGEGTPETLTMPVPVPGSSRARAGSGEEGEAAPGSGPEPGRAHDPHVRGDEATRLDRGPAASEAAVAQDTGDGATASETIRTAAESGFVRPSYQKLFHEYRSVAEEVLSSEKIPPGHKSHVERYFQLIRPRTSVRKSEGETKTP